MRSVSGDTGLILLMRTSRLQPSNTEKTILVPIDFSPVTRLVVREAAKLARATDAKLVLMHSIAPPPMIAVDLVTMVEPSLMWTKEAEKSAKRHLRHLQSVLTKDGLQVEVLCTMGYPVPCIRAQMQKLPASYVVIGSHGHTALHDLVMGSTTGGVLKRASCPVVVVPAIKGKGRQGRKP